MPSLLVIQKLAKALETTMASLMAELESEASAGSEGVQQERKQRPPVDSQTARVLVKGPKKRSS